MRARTLAGCAVLALTTLAACKREPSFEERYAGAEKAIREKAGELDKDMARRAAEAHALAPKAEDTGSASGAPGAI